MTLPPIIVWQLIPLSKTSYFLKPLHPRGDFALLNKVNKNDSCKEGNKKMTMIF